MIKIALRFTILISLSVYVSFSQWSTVSQLPVNELGAFPSISVPNCSTFVVCGGTNNFPAVFISTNSGLNFSNITGNISTNELYCVYALNKDTIFTGDGGTPGGSGGNARVYKTTNGGINWTVMLSTGGNNGFISGIQFSKVNPDFGIIVSDPALSNDSFWIAKTFNRGSSWQITKAFQTAPYITQNSLFVVDSQYYGFGLITNPAKLYMTSTGGSSWVVRTIGLNGTSVPSIAFQSDKLNGIALSDAVNPNIARTTDGGISWQSTNTGSNATVAGIIKWIPGTGIYFFASGFMKRTSDNGLTWHEMNTGGVVNFSQMDVYSVSPNSICAYTIASNGKILKFEGEPFGIDPSNLNVPVDYKLEQNFPNPFNPETTVKYSIPKAGIVKLAVYDLNGRVVKLITDSYHSVGNYVETINMNGFSSGIYLYEISAGDITLSGKMVLVK